MTTPINTPFADLTLGEAPQTQPKKEPVRISLPSEPTATPTVRLPDPVPATDVSKDEEEAILREGKRLIRERDSRTAPKSEGTPPSTIADGVSRTVWSNTVVKTLTVLALFLGILAGVRHVIWTRNANIPFAITGALDHGGNMFRQIGLAPVDYLSEKKVHILHDFWGRKTVLIQVGERRFIQTASGQPAREVMPPVK